MNTVGGSGNVLYSNVIQATNCMTRLRLRLIEQNDYMIDALKKIDGVLGVNVDGDEVQVILGAGRATSVTNAVNRNDAPNVPRVAAVGAGSLSVNGVAIQADSSRQRGECT